MSRIYSAFGINQNVYQGSGCVDMLPEILEREKWKKVLIVAGPAVIRNGIIKRFENMLEYCGAQYKTFSQIEPNPRARDIEKSGVPMYKNMDADVMLAIGGGSTIDSAKGIAIIGNSDKTIKADCESIGRCPPHEKLPWDTFPVIAVPTTCGTGSEVIRNAVISDENRRKMVLMNDCILPKYALCDPDLLSTLPSHVAAASSMDALVQAVEALVSLAANDFSRTMSFRAIELIGPNIVKFFYNRTIPEFADAMSKGCMYAGIAWNNSFPAQNHGCNHAITELLHIPHGDACAIVMPWFIEWNGEVCREDFWKVYRLMCPNCNVKLDDFEVSMLVEKFKKLNRQLNILNGKTMADFGCNEQLCQAMVENFFESPCYPRSTTKIQMYEAMVKIMKGKYI